MKKCHRAKIQLLCLCNKQCLYFFVPSPALTFLTEHAVAEEDLCEDSVALQDSSQHAAGVCGDALTPQVQSAAARHCPRVMQLSQNRLLSLYSSLFTQPQIRPPEVLHERLQRSLSQTCRAKKTRAAFSNLCLVSAQHCLTWSRSDAGS